MAESLRLLVATWKDEIYIYCTCVVMVHKPLSDVAYYDLKIPPQLFKIIFPILVSVILFVITLFVVVMPRMEELLMERKREMIQALTEVAWKSVNHYFNMAEKGVISEELAKKQALDHIRDLRYGEEQKDYFWINDKIPSLIMHPYRPDLEGEDQSKTVDPTGKPFFLSFIGAVREDGAGFVDYQWQWQDNPDKVVPKISYVKEFAPWQWIIGTGVYVEDVRDEIETITRQIVDISIAITSMIVILSGYVIWQGAMVDLRRRRATASLEASEAKYRLLAETAREIIITTDSDLCITYINQTWLDKGGVELEALIGKSVHTILDPDHIDQFDEQVKRLSGNRKEAYLFESLFRTFSGRTVPVEVTCVLMPQWDNIFGYLVAARDITKKKEAEAKVHLQQEQLYQSAKLASLGTLVSGVAHEINNPISTVTLNIQTFQKIWEHINPVLSQLNDANHELLGSGMDFKEIERRIPKLLDDTADGADRIRRIVLSLRDFSGKGSPEMHDSVNINLASRRAVGLVHNLIIKSTTDFQQSYREGLPEFTGNLQRIEQVIVNLLVNACQAMEDMHKPIGLSTGRSENGSAVYLEIHDRGVGIEKDVMGSIKDPFFTTKRDGGGIGLGLSISDTIVRDHGGRLTFSSQPDRGTIVRVTFPLAHNEDSKEKKA